MDWLFNTILLPMLLWYAVVLLATPRFSYFPDLSSQLRRGILKILGTMPMRPMRTWKTPQVARSSSAAVNIVNIVNRQDGQKTPRHQLKHLKHLKRGQNEQIPSETTRSRTDLGSTHLDLSHPTGLIWLVICWTWITWIHRPSKNLRDFGSITVNDRIHRDLYVSVFRSFLYRFYRISD
jgi:hypothetical protein